MAEKPSLLRLELPPVVEVLHDGSVVTAGERDASPRGLDDASRGDRLATACGWCAGPFRRGCRRDAAYCSTRCRQAAHRFHKPSRLAGASLRVASGLPLRLAYADPPYPGTAARYYSEHPDFAGEVDHRQLIARLVEDFPDGWALSTSAAALPAVLPSCPPGARIAAWFRGERPTASYSPLSAWEPVIYVGGRHELSRGSARRVDALAYIARARTTDPRRVVGSKPAAFCAWLFKLLGAAAGDEFVDLFPGSGGVALSWETYASAARDASRVASFDASSPDPHATRSAHQVDASRFAAARHDASNLEARRMGAGGFSND